MSAPASLRVRPVSQLVARLVDWLWLARLGQEKLALLEGDPGLGKSLLALDLCARLSRGLPFPDGTPSPGPANSIVLNGEDGAEDTILPRLKILGADLERVFVAHSDLEAAAWRFPSQTRPLDETLAQTNARLLVIDPITSFLDPGLVCSSDLSIRRALHPLACLAEKHRCAVLMHRHLNKTGSHCSLYRGSGSIGFIAACRSAWLAARDPHEPGRCVLAQVKNNLAPPQPSLAYRVTGEVGSAPTLDWLGACAWTADELLAGARTAPVVAPRDRAAEFLREFLAKGPRTAREVWTAAQELQLAERTLNRAKRDLGIRSQRVGGGAAAQTYWLLPGQKPPVDPETDLEPWLGPLREQFPPATPLDEV